MNRPVEVGDLIRINEPDYCYGTGDLMLEVTAAPTRLGDPEWVGIESIEIWNNGQRGNQRFVNMRLKALDDRSSRRIQ